LKNSGLKEADSPDDVQPGQWYLSSLDAVTICSSRVVCPHNLIGINKNGELMIPMIIGKFRHIGVTAEKGAQLMKDLGAVDVIVTSNGGDVAFYRRDERVFGSETRIGERAQFSSVLLLVKPWIVSRVLDTFIFKFPGFLSHNRG
jgi:hypothetical protein